MAEIDPVYQFVLRLNREVGKDQPAPSRKGFAFFLIQVVRTKILSRWLCYVWFPTVSEAAALPGATPSPQQIKQQLARVTDVHLSER